MTSLKSSNLPCSPFFFPTIQESLYGSKILNVPTVSSRSNTSHPQMALFPWCSHFHSPKKNSSSFKNHVNLPSHFFRLLRQIAPSPKSRQHNFSNYAFTSTNHEFHISIQTIKEKCLRVLNILKFLPHPTNGCVRKILLPSKQSLIFLIIGLNLWSCSSFLLEIARLNLKLRYLNSHRCLSK